MKYVFFGSPRFAEIILRELIHADLAPAMLVCNPDRPAGRKKILTAPQTKTLVSTGADGAGGASRSDNTPAAHIEVFQPEKMDAAAIEHLRALAPDFFVVAAYAKILPTSALEIPRLGTLGVHPSLLPKYRGAAPIQTAIMHGEQETGVSIYLVDAQTDHGPIVDAGAVPLAANETYLTLEEKLAMLGAELLTQTIPNFLAGSIRPKIQNEAHATFTKKFTTQDGFIADTDLMTAETGDGEKAIVLLRKINALNPEPGAWTMKNGKRIKLLEAKISSGKLVLTKIQEEGQKPRAI